MIWIPLSILTGLFHALSSALMKKTSEKTNAYMVSFCYMFFSLPFIAIIALNTNLVPTNSVFWYATIISSILIVSALILYVKALKTVQFSCAMPLLSLTPLFLIFTSALMLKEFPSYLGILGILLIIFGTYMLALRQGGHILDPFKIILKSKGSKLLLIAALIYAINANFNKIAIQETNPITFIVFLQIINSFILFSLLIFKSKLNFSEIKPNLKYFIPMGLFLTLGFMAQMTALTMAIVPYVISLKRSSAFFGVIIGFFIFKEKNIKEKLLGTIIMIIGVILITIG